MRAALLLALVVLAGCVRHADAPAHPTAAESGVAPDDFNATHACVDWVASTTDPTAVEHDAFPDTSAHGCYAEVHYQGARVWVDDAAPGCGYPDAGAMGAIERRASEEEVAATSWKALESQPIELACDLPEGIRQVAARANARTLRSLARAWSDAPPTKPYPYAVVGTFGYGEPRQARSALAHWRPGDPCVDTTWRDLSVLSVNLERSKRAADAYHAGAAPLVTVSGGAVHSPVYEAFFLSHLLSCEYGVPADRILVDPCADHTHTNIRNTGGMVTAVGGRFAYLVTDDFLQSDYLEEWTGFDLMGGSIDQRALRDFGYLIGAWRRASIGMKAGFWYTPYRFWASPGEARGLSCMGDPPRE